MSEEQLEVLESSEICEERERGRKEERNQTKQASEKLWRDPTKSFQAMPIFVASSQVHSSILSTSQTLAFHTRNVIPPL